MSDQELDVAAGKQAGIAREQMRERFATQKLAQGADDVMEEILDRIAAADTLTDILDQGKLISVEEILDRDINIMAFSLRESDFAGTDVYAVLTVVDPVTGEEFPPVQCGGRIVCMQLVRIEKVSGFPVRVQIQKFDTRTEGQVVYRLVAPASPPIDVQPVTADA